MLGGLFSLLVHNWVHNMAYYYAGIYQVYGPYKGPSNRIHDFGFEWFGTAFVGWSTPPGDIVLYITLAIAIVYALRPLVFSFPTRTLNILWRVLTMSIFTVTGRCISFIFTLLPSSAQHCAEDEFDPPKNWGEIFTHVSVSGGCSDLIYSGHMMYAILATCAIFRYAQNWYIKATCLALNILQGFVIVASRAHYSVDVIVAAYTIPAFWCTFAYFVPEDIGPNAVPIEKTSLAAEEGPPVDPARSVGGGVLDLELGATGASSAASPVQA
ncbi:conserved hypothetical protein [Perkinsus marinus ATCC 50983]|uniref:Sphingomyelin synthase-like domain-containing protein n=1 Tax=Perkinsus marinus (strain ATCC 50983 / TXsc) TaxID=423536 RepID=C5KN45_PERM5|nr:conserved hypothetical protein [Perkinsus marinus ATCC 50983]EER14079.1 conserved hypothetical protein [Perkinsus marinus ATCC 50983]|eukprot:XP_002782284.1 conserved hypothetical protein [Perkinsus marinus ATCC 50983]